MKARFGKELVSDSKNRYHLTKQQYEFWQENRPVPKIQYDYEVKSKPMSDSDFERYHREYLREKFVKTTLGTFQGKYILICFDESGLKSFRYFVETAKGAKAIAELQEKHQGHRWLLLHQSRSKRYGIKKRDPIWRDLA